MSSYINTNLDHMGGCDAIGKADQQVFEEAASYWNTALHISTRFLTGSAEHCQPQLTESIESTGFLFKFILFH